jgi:glycosyltransferase involved in cell wall biosynthesis
MEDFCPMNVAISPQQSTELNNGRAPHFAVPAFTDDAERWDWLLKTLGEPLCHKLGIFRIPAELVLSVVIPVYNERATIREILARVRAVPIKTQIIVVDDCSTDGTREVLADLEKRDPTLVVIYHERNQGKGAALRTGFRAATGSIVIVQDADLEYEPEQYPELIRPIVEGRADVVFGSRFIGETHRVLYFWHYLANKCLTLLSNMFTNLNLTDMEVCYKVFRREVIQGIKLRSDRFGFEPEVTAKVARFAFPGENGQPSRPCRIYELPVSYHGRTYREGKKIGMKDGFQALYCILRFAYAD